jgi:hypothetical protein
VLGNRLAFNAARFESFEAWWRIRADERAGEGTYLIIGILVSER